jgi:hypothetical protein
MRGAPQEILMSVLPDQNHDSDLDRVTGVIGEIRAFVQQQETNVDGQAIANDLAALLHRAAHSSVQEIDAVMAQLELLREKVQGDGARVQRHLVNYATLTQSTLQTTRVISESLRKSFSRRD